MFKYLGVTLWSIEVAKIGQCQKKKVIQAIQKKITTEQALPKDKLQD
jgi:hypothetical protein